MGSADELEVSEDFWWFSLWYQAVSHVALAFFLAGYGIVWFLWGRERGGRNVIESLKEHDRRQPW